MVNRRYWASLICLICTILPAINASAEQWREIPAVYRGVWTAIDDASQWRRLAIGGSTIEILDEDGRKQVCVAKAITTYRTGFLGLLGDPAARVECVVSNAPSKRQAPHIVRWAIIIVQAIDGHALQVEVQTESENGTLESGAVGLFER
jgi:hypothetical protein